MVTAQVAGRRPVERGGSLQPWHALGGVAGWADALPRARVTAGGAGAALLVVDAAALGDAVEEVPPKFAFAVLRALVKALPAANQAGGGRAVHAVEADAAAAAEDGRADDDDDDDVSSSAARLAAAPSPLEKVLVLRDAKLLRFVPERFLPLLADVAACADVKRRGAF